MAEKNGSKKQPRKPWLPKPEDVVETFEIHPPGMKTPVTVHRTNELDPTDKSPAEEEEEEKEKE